MDQLDRLVAKLLKEDRAKVRAFIRRHNLNLTPEALAAYFANHNPEMSGRDDTLLIAQMELNVWWNKSPYSQ